MGFAADEIPMPPGDPETLSSAVLQLKDIQEWTDDSYLVTNGGDTGFFNAAWPNGNGAGAANGEARSLVDFIKTGSAETTTASKSLSTYHGKLAAAHKKVGGWHKSWDAAENTYNTKMRTLDRQYSPGSADYDDFRDSYTTDRDRVQGPIRTSYPTEMNQLRTAARTAAQALGALFQEPNGTSISGYLSSNLPITANTEDTQAGINLANKIKREQAKHPPDYKAIRTDLKTFKRNSSNSAYSNGFIHGLGPKELLEIPDDLVMSADTSESKAAQRKSNGDLLTAVADATAHYIASGTAGPKFGDDLRAAAKGSIPSPNSDAEPANIVGHRALGLLLAAGHNWPPHFLAGAADDIYQHERQLVRAGNKNDPWHTHSGTLTLNDPLTNDDPGHGDPLTNALSALGHNRAAAQEFFLVGNSNTKGNNGSVDLDKLHYLIKKKAYGIYVPDGPLPGDRGKSLGQALYAAAAKVGDNADGTARTIAEAVVATIGSDVPTDPNDIPTGAYPALQPPGMRKYTGHILANYIHGVDNTLAPASSDGHDHTDNTAIFIQGQLKAAMDDTFVYTGAYTEVMKAAIVDCTNNIDGDINSATSYDQLTDQLHYDMGRTGGALGSIFNSRTQPLLTHAQSVDEQNKLWSDNVSSVISVGATGASLLEIPGATPVGIIMSEVWQRALGAHLLPTDHADNLISGRGHPQQQSISLMKGDPIGNETRARLDALYQKPHDDTHSPASESRLLWIEYQQAFITAGGENLSGDEVARWRKDYTP